MQEMYGQMLLELARRFLTAVIFAAGLFSVILAAIPYVRVPGLVVAYLGEIHPVLGIVSAGLGLIVFFQIPLRAPTITDRSLDLIYRGVKRVF
ncbi:hypothetical protein [Ensifer sp. SL37]|uniref:hypothetical protein n=1 Tax=Ensifer sp. SL37 TaxID=2995137 RepID=UPI002273C379|nr:hypothetical protein [Ensifer sp. SL37]MCY1740976.1 hypothetical protein [Ensifer sp. SL37]